MNKKTGVSTTALDPEVRAALDAVGRRNAHAHLMGCGGVGMAGLGRLLAARGIRVSGCDLVLNRLTAWLGGFGIPVAQGHDAAHLDDGVTWVIRSAAVAPHAAELQAAQARGLPISRRGAVLAALIEGRPSVAVSGTHGKTTTTSMITQVLAACGLRPGFCIGGETDKLGGVAAPGPGPLVVEADESDGTVALYRPAWAVITNVDWDHMEHFAGRADLEACFVRFAQQAREGVAVCADDDAAWSAGRRARVCVSYGFSGRAEYVAEVERESPSGVVFSIWRGGRREARVQLPVPGRHNVLNATATWVVGLHLGCPTDKMAACLAEFAPVRRRFEIVVSAENLTVVSDYAHHPAEIRAVLDMARLFKPNRMLAVFQPHRYTRTRALGPEFPPAFRGVSLVFLVPVYAASEAPLPGGTAEDLLARFRAHRESRVEYCHSLREAWMRVRSELRPGDMLLVLGAGDVEQVAQWAKEELAAGVLPSGRLGQMAAEPAPEVS